MSLALELLPHLSEVIIKLFFYDVHCLISLIKVFIESKLWLRYLCVSAWHLLPHDELLKRVDLV